MNKIVIAPGHGGSDPGATGNGLEEKNLNLTTGLACYNFMQNFDGHETILTRETDKLVSLSQQREIVRDFDADLFVDIHYNSFHDPAAHGFETFIYKGEVFETTKRNQRKIHNATLDYLEKYNIRDRGMKRSRHWTVTNVPCSVVLVEGLFISNPREAKIISDEKVQQNVGEAIAIGIANALKLKEIEPVSDDLPKIQREIGVKLDGEDTGEVGYLINGSTYVRAAYLMSLHDIKVTGHGNWINIHYDTPTEPAEEPEKPDIPDNNSEPEKEEPDLPDGLMVLLKKLYELLKKIFGW